jgi:hypothetical protein
MHPVKKKSDWQRVCVFIHIIVWKWVKLMHVDASELDLQDIAEYLCQAPNSVCCIWSRGVCISREYIHAPRKKKIGLAESLCLYSLIS